MDTLNKKSIKDWNYSKSTVIEKKRKDNNRRTRNARLARVNDRRKIVSEIENESINDTLDPVSEKPQKPSRMKLLEIWRENKEKEKLKNRRIKPKFVVKHLEYKDQGVFVGAGVTQTNKKDLKLSHHRIEKKPPKPLREKNAITAKSIIAKIDSKKDIKKQPYAEWKKTQNNGSTTLRPKTRSFKKNNANLDQERKQYYTSQQNNIINTEEKNENIVDIKNDSKIEIENISTIQSSTKEENNNLVDGSFSFEPPLFISAKTPTNISNKQETEKLHLKTPISLFRDREDICNKTDQPGSCTANSRNTTPNCRKLSLTPKNFLSRIEDPVAIKLASPSLNEEFKLQEIPPEVAASVKLFTGKVTAEEKIFTNSIKEWELILQCNEAPESVHGDILSAIGQAQLLMRKRFKQFKELIELHKDKSAEKAAHASDLDGFWEVIYMQVEDVHKRFEELNTLRKNNWEVPEEKIVLKKPKKVGRPKITKVVKETKVNTKRNEIKKFRQQMLQKKKEMECQMMGPTGAFISVLTPSKSGVAKKVTPLRRSLRHLDIKDKNSPLSIGFMVSVNENKKENKCFGDPLEEDKVDLLNMPLQQQLVISSALQGQDDLGNNAFDQKEDEDFFGKYLQKPTNPDHARIKSSNDLMYFSP